MPGGAVLHFAGQARLDNHRELAGRLHLPATVDAAELICHAYVAHGEGFARLLLGDFSFALFDPGRQVLLLVRDPLGVCPLYYHLGPDRCVASNSLDRLRGQAAVAGRLEDRVVAEWCVNGNVYNQAETFFQGIRKCPRATLLRLDSQGLRSEAYWRPAELAPLRYADERDYAAHLRDLLDNVIASRLDTRAPVAAHCSGGLDSTPIAILAGRASLQAGQVFYSYNWCAPDADDSSASHEWDDARRVAGAEGFTHHEVGASAASLTHSLLHHDVACDGTTMFEYERAVLAHAQQRGIRTIYSGFGGDELLTARSRDRYHDAIRAGRFLELLRRLALEADPRQDWRRLRLAAAFGRSVYRSLRPSSAAGREQARLARTRLEAKRALLKPGFADFALNFYRPIGDMGADTIKARQHQMLSSGYHQERIESWAILGLRAGVRHVYPYLDQRIVEFALAIPSELYFRHGRPRHLYLQALGDTLPDHLRHKPKLPESLRVRQLIRARIQALSSPEVLDRIAGADSPYVDTQALLAKCVQARQLDAGDLKACIGPVQALTTAVLALNIGCANR